MRLISRFFLFLSKTDSHVISFCTFETRITQQSLGFMVLLTGSFAFYSCFYAINSTFDNANVAAMAALLYAVTIMTFDRELVSITSSDKRALVLRVPIAIVMAVFISIPLEMRLMEGRIDAEIVQMVTERNTEATGQIQELQKWVQDRRNIEKERIQSMNGQLIKLSGTMEREERDRNGIGPKYRALRKQYEELSEKLDQAQKKFVKIGYTKDQEKIIAESKNKLNVEIKKSTDLLSRIEALERIQENSPAARFLSWVIRAFFILLELFPVVVKFFLPYNEYQAYLNSRRNMNIQKAHCYANWALAEIEKDPWGSLSRKEFSDDLEKGIEDSIRQTMPHLNVPKP